MANPRRHVSLLFLHRYSLWSCKGVTWSQILRGREKADPMWRNWGYRSHSGVFCLWSRMQSSAHGSDSHYLYLKLWNDTVGEIGRLWGGLALPPPRLISGTLTSRSGSLQKRLKGNTRSPSCRQSLNLRLGADVDFKLFCSWLRVVEVWNREKASYSRFIPGASPVTPSLGSSVGSEILLPGDELAGFMSPPSHPFAHSFCPSFPHPPPVPVSSRDTVLLYNTPAVRLLNQNPSLLRSFPVQEVTQHTQLHHYLQFHIILHNIIVPGIIPCLS